MKEKSERQRELMVRVKAILVTRIGKARRITREDLIQMVSGKPLLVMGSGEVRVQDREIRQAIADLRDDDQIGALICSSSGVAGYWIAANARELEQSVGEERRRGITILQRAKYRESRGLAQLDKAQRELPGFMGLDVSRWQA